MKSTSDDLFALIKTPFGANQARFRELLRKYGTETTNDEGIKDSFSRVIYTEVYFLSWEVNLFIYYYSGTS